VNAATKDRQPRAIGRATDSLANPKFAPLSKIQNRTLMIHSRRLFRLPGFLICSLTHCNAYPPAMPASGHNQHASASARYRRSSPRHFPPSRFLVATVYFEAALPALRRTCSPS
jgi:hypothetical protein